MPQTATVFGLVVRERREKLGISQEELAFRADLHRTFISMIERGKRTPSLEAIRKLSKALETSATSLVSKTESRWD